MKQALLGRLINFGKDDMVQSVGQGGNDSAVDFRGISNYIKAQRVLYTITSNDVSSGQTGAIQITWAVPFADSNYTLTASLNLVSFSGGTFVQVSPGYTLRSASLPNASGFQIVIGINEEFATAGDILNVAAIAIHD